MNHQSCCAISSWYGFSPVTEQGNAKNGYVSMIEFMLDRLKKASRIEKFVHATSENPINEFL
jgi:hypothetical protein